MKVRELLAILEDCDPGADVRIWLLTNDLDTYVPIDNVTEELGKRGVPGTVTLEIDILQGIQENSSRDG